MQTQKRLSDLAIATLKRHTKAKNRLGILFSKSGYTIERYIRNKDIRLTSEAVVRIISEESGLSEKEILDEQETVVA